MPTDSQVPPSRPRPPVTLRQAHIEAMRSIPPITVINRLFPNFIIEEEIQGKSWKVRVEDGHLHINGPLFNLLEHSEDTRYRGGGGIDAYCVMANLQRQSRESFSKAAQALTAAFFPWMNDPAVPAVEKIRRLASAKEENEKVNVATANKRVRGPVELPAMSTEPGEVQEGKNYLIRQRGFSPKFVEQAFSARAFYVNRMESKFPGSRRGPLRLVFPLCNYENPASKVSYSARSLTSSFKKNQGDKSRAGFILGNFEEGKCSVLAVCESPIEAASRWQLLQSALKDRPDLLAECVVVGVNGSGRQHDLLRVAHARGIQTVLAGYNNDYAGRRFNRQLLDDAKEAGIPHGELDLVPGGEVKMFVFPHPTTQAAETSIRAQIEALKAPVKALRQIGQGTVVQFPNHADICATIEEIDKKRIGFQLIGGGNGSELLAHRDQLIADCKAKNKATKLAEHPDGWKLSILNDQEVQGMVNQFKHAHESLVQQNQLGIEFRRLIKFEFVCKDFNDVLKGGQGREFPDVSLEEPAVIVDLVEKARHLRLSKGLENADPSIT